MKGDFTRFSHDPDKHYTSVLKQQGRVSLDSDWNEYVAIRSYLERTEALDVIGCCGVPQEGSGFKVKTATEEEDELELRGDGEPGNTLAISPGRIYVNGLLCENPPVDRDASDESARLLTEQEHHPTFELPEESDLFEEGEIYVAYLDVWQRHVTALEDREIREVALGGPDTTTRLQTVWQVRLEPYEEDQEGEAPPRCPTCNWKSRTEEPRLRAWINPSEQEKDLCEMPESGGYRGIENRLYRVEVHEGTKRGDSETATFKWSRDNGAVVYSVTGIDPSRPSLTIGEQPRDDTVTLDGSQWVELSCEDWKLEQRPGLLCKVKAVQSEAGPGRSDGQRIDLDSGTVDEDRLKTLQNKLDASGEALVTVRRWDQTPENGGSIEIEAGKEIQLEQGIIVQFEEREDPTYKTGDYWTIPARAALEDVLWPTEDEDRRDSDPEKALFQEREGIRHHSCPLALVRVESGEEDGITIRKERDCRRTFPPLIETERDGCCRTVEPDEDLQQAVHEVIEAGGGCISLCRGVHRVEAPLDLRGARALTIRGEGEATLLHLVGGTEETRGGIVLHGCREVTLADMLVLGEDSLPAVVTTAADAEAANNRGVALEDVTVVHRTVVPRKGAETPPRPGEEKSGAEEETGRIVGTVTDAETGEPLLGANVLILGTNRGTTTNAEGRFKISGVEPSTRSLRVKFVGYHTAVKDVSVQPGETTRVNVELRGSEVEVGEEGEEPEAASHLASAVRLANASDVQIHNSRLLAPVGVQALWDHEVPDVPPVQDEEPPGERITIDFESLEDGEEFEIGEGIQTEEAVFRVVDSDVFTDFKRKTAQVDVRDGRTGIECRGTRLDIDFVENFERGAKGLKVRVINQIRTYELQVNGESDFVHNGGMIGFDGRTIGGVEVRVEEADPGPGQVLSFTGSVETLGIGGKGPFIHELSFRTQSLPEPEPPSYGDGVRDLEVRDTEIHFTEFGIFSCRSERWTVEDSSLTQLSPSHGGVDLPSQFDTLQDAVPLYDAIDLPTWPSYQERPRRGSAVKSILWRDSRIENCQLAGARGVDLWWQIRGSIQGNTLRVNERGLHAFWIHDADWSENTVDAYTVTLSFAGCVRARIDGNRTGGHFGLANFPLATVLGDLGRFILGLQESYGLPDGRHQRILLLWLLLEETVQLLGLRDIVTQIKEKAIQGYEEGGVTGVHRRLLRQPVLYVAADFLLPVLEKWVKEKRNWRLFPIVALEVLENRMECERDAIALEGFLTAGGIDIADNHLHAGLGDTQGQTVLLNASPYSVNVHLVNAILQQIVDSAESEGWDLGDALPRFSADNRIRGNTLTSLNTAIESNLFDLDVTENHVTLLPRPVSRTEIKKGLATLKQYDAPADLAPVVRSGSVGELTYLRDQYAAEAASLDADSFGNGKSKKETMKFSQEVDRYATEAAEAKERGDRAGTAAGRVALLDKFRSATNTYGIWVKGPGGRIDQNHVVLPPELELKKQARGGIRLGGGKKVPIDSLAEITDESPLLGITETVVASNEIIRGSGTGVEIRELYLARDGKKRAPTSGDAEGYTVNIRANEISGLAEGGIVVDPFFEIADLEIVENTIVGCGWGPDQGLSHTRYGGVYVAEVLRARLHGNRIFDSLDGVFALELEEINRLVMTDNTLRGRGRWWGHLWPASSMSSESSGMALENVPFRDFELWIPENRLFLGQYYLAKITVREYVTVHSGLFEPVNREQWPTCPLWLDPSEGRGIVTNNTSTNGEAIVVLNEKNIESGFNYPKIS